jgi:predicted Zn-dependent peptidase
MLDEGAGGRSALELADEVEFLGASLATSSSFDASTVRLNVPAGRLDAALPLMADVALRPSVPAEELERLRQERLTSLLQARDDASSVASMAFARVLYGDDHRYGIGALGTRGSLGTLTVDDLRAFHAAWYRPGRALLIVVGSVAADRVVPRLEEAFGGWRETGDASSRTAVVEAPRSSDRRVHIVDMPGAAQSEIRIGWVGVSRSTPDYFTLQVLNTVLGGAFTSRLNQNLREEHGYTYGASSRFDMRLAAGPFLAGAGVQTDKTAESLREFFNELEAIGAPVGDDELTKAKNYVALGFPSEFETIGDLAGRLEDMAIHDLPESHFADYVNAIQAVTAGQVQAAAAAHVQPDRFVIVVAGDRAVIEPGIRALDLGPVTTMTVEEALAD